MKRIKTILLVILLGVVLIARAEKKPTMQPVYIFGVSMSFTDSVAYVTDVVKVDSAWITPKGFLVDRTLYSLQLEGFVTEHRQSKQSTNAVFFDVKEDKIVKKLNRVKKLYQTNRDVRLLNIPKAEFTFKAEAYVDPNAIVEEEETPEEKEEQK